MKSKQMMNIIMKNINKNISNNVIAIVPSIMIMEIQLRERGTRTIPNHTLDDIRNPCEELLAFL